MSPTSTAHQDARDQVAGLAEDAKATARAVAEDRAATLRDTASQRVSNTAAAANAAAGHFDPASLQAEALHGIADRVDEFAARLRQGDVSALASEVGDFARRNPALFIGAAALAGFAATRFLKARGPAPAAAFDDTDPWGHPDHASTISELNKEQRHG